MSDSYPLEQARNIAHHEAGHALVCIWATPLARVARLEITDTGGCCYHDSVLPAWPSRGDLIARVAILLAGEESVYLVTRDRAAARIDSESDQKAIEGALAHTQIAMALTERPFTDDDMDEIRRVARLVATTILSAALPAVRAIARELLFEGQVDGARVHQIAERRPLSPVVVEAVRNVTSEEKTQ